MITVNVLYPNRDGATFDMDYYLTSHIPMLKRVFGSALKGCIVEQALGGGAPGTKAEFAVLCHLRFDSVSRTSRRAARSPDRSRTTWRTMRARRRSSSSAT